MSFLIVEFILMEKSIRWTLKNKNPQYLYIIPQQDKWQMHVGP